MEMGQVVIPKIEETIDKGFGNATDKIQNLLPPIIMDTPDLGGLLRRKLYLKPPNWIEEVSVD